jgi:predicted lipid-binding transport protein (Tim44 family)
MSTTGWLILGTFLVVAVLLAGWLKARATRLSPAASSPASRYGNDAPEPIVPKSYSPFNVGNDASARPWESDSVLPDDLSAALREASAASQVDSAFDTDAFLDASRRNFIRLQAAWDKADMAVLRTMMTDAMLADIQTQLQERERSGAGNQTDVVMLEAKLLNIEDITEAYLASVEFSGLIREDASAGPNPFREVWSITRPKEGNGGWLVAGVQALQ